MALQKVNQFDGCLDLNILSQKLDGFTEWNVMQIFNASKLENLSGIVSACVGPRYDNKSKQWSKKIGDVSICIQANEKFVLSECKELAQKFPYQVNVWIQEGSCIVDC